MKVERGLHISMGTEPPVGARWRRVKIGAADLRVCPGVACKHWRGRPAGLPRLYIRRILSDFDGHCPILAVTAFYTPPPAVTLILTQVPALESRTTHVS